MILNETYSLANGVQVPKLGLGTWFIDDAEAAEAVREAVKLGYRLIDTAQAYGNERGVGEGVRTCGVRREEPATLIANVLYMLESGTNVSKSAAGNVIEVELR